MPPAEGLRADGHPVPALQHPLPARRDGRGERPRAGRRSSPPPRARPREPGSLRLGGLRADERHDDAVLRSAGRSVGRRAWSGRRASTPRSSRRSCLPRRSSVRSSPASGRRRGSGRARVIAPATHDTGSAVAAVPAAGDGLGVPELGHVVARGVETAAPVITEAARRANLTNEGGIAGTNRLLRNVMGLWLVQRLRAESDDAPDYETLTAEAAAAPPLGVLRRSRRPAVSEPAFDARCRSRASCAETGQDVPAERGGLRPLCAARAWPSRYRAVLDDLRRVTGREIGTIHVVGGGAQNRLARADDGRRHGRPGRRRARRGHGDRKPPGPGARARAPRGPAGGPSAGRPVVPREHFEPRDTGRWDETYERFSRRRR